MRQETQTIIVCQFAELNDDAKDCARQWYRSSMGDDAWAWGDEWRDSAQAFSRIAPIKITDADFERGHVSIEWQGPDHASRYDHSDAIAELTGLRAWVWLTNNNWFVWAQKNREGECTMTGFCGDCAFGDALKEYERNPRRVPELKQVFYEMAQSWVYAARRDMESSNSDEYIDETIIANEYEFTDSGDFYG